jgi:hypothetical protein
MLIVKLTSRAILNGKYTYKLAWSRARKFKAIPRYTLLPKNKKKLLAIYVKAQLKNMGSRTKYEVDHIIPLYHPLVCGLHSHLNLQILPKATNQLKSNQFKPYREKNGRKYYYDNGYNPQKHVKIAKKYNQTKKNPLKLAKKRSKISKSR